MSKPQPANPTNRVRGCATHPTCESNETLKPTRGNCIFHPVGQKYSCYALLPAHRAALDKQQRELAAHQDYLEQKLVLYRQFPEGEDLQAA